VCAPFYISEISLGTVSILLSKHQCLAQGVLLKISLCVKVNIARTPKAPLHHPFQSNWSIPIAAAIRGFYINRSIPSFLPSFLVSQVSFKQVNMSREDEIRNKTQT
jgi:hypothetical protein